MTPKQEAFVREYLIDLNATAAYRRAGYAAKGHAAEVEASKLLRNPEVASAIAAAQEKIAENHGITLDQHITDLKRIRDAAFDEGKFAAAASAEIARGKVAGFYVERVEVKDVSISERLQRASARVK